MKTEPETPTGVVALAEFMAQRKGVSVGGCRFCGELSVAAVSVQVRMLDEKKQPKGPSRTSQLSLCSRHAMEKAEALFTMLQDRTSTAVSDGSQALPARPQGDKA